MPLLRHFDDSAKKTRRMDLQAMRGDPFRGLAR